MEYRLAKGWLAFLFLFAAALFFFGLYILLHSSAPTDRGRVALRRTFFPRSIPVNEIEGFGVGEKGSIYVAAGGGARIWISPSMNGRSEILEWLRARYPDLNNLQNEKDKRTILHNDLYGHTQKEREDNLRKAVLAVFAAVIRQYDIYLWSVSAWSVDRGDSVSVHLRAGKWGIPWYEVWRD